MLPSASALASRREERVQKAFSVDHHGPGDARLSHRATPIYGEHSDYVHRLFIGTRASVHRWGLRKGHSQGSIRLLDAPGPMHAHFETGRSSSIVG